jgi:diguanylate cyclase (GGDEF)-like protein
METVLKLQVNILCILVIAILWLSMDRRRYSRDAADTRPYRMLLASTAALLAFDSAGWLLDGTPGRMGRASVAIADSLYDALHSLPAACFIVYSDFQATRDGTRSRRVARPLLAIVAANAILAFASPFLGLYFSLDELNRYRRGPGFFVFAILQYGLVAYALVLLILKRKRMSRGVYLTLLAYPLPTIAASAIQNLRYGLVLVWPVTTLFLVAAAFNIENRRSKTDYLTGTANRRSLDEELERRIGALRPGRELCGLMIDIDDFKSINDLSGHEAGDRALEDVASILQSSIRVDDMVARMGGDEFVILAELEAPAAIESLVRRIESAVENRNAASDRPYSIALSIGRAAYERAAGGKASDFLALLDADMYGRKRGKKCAARRPSGA